MEDTREFAWIQLMGAIRSVVGGSPWTDEFEAEIEAFRLRFNELFASAGRP